MLLFAKPLKIAKVCYYSQMILITSFLRRRLKQLHLCCGLDKNGFAAVCFNYVTL